MLELILFSVPTVIYVLVVRRSLGNHEALHRAGIGWGTVGGWILAALLLPVQLALGWASLRLIPAETLTLPGVQVARVVSVLGAVGVAGRAFGEEILFRGLLAGWLVRRHGFALGNLLQAAVFMVPHLVLLVVDTRLWPVIGAQLGAGWLMGWVRHRSGSFVPGGVLHTLANALAGALAGPVP